MWITTDAACQAAKMMTPPRKDREMFKNGMRPIHPGDVLREDFLGPMDMSANALAKQLHVPASRINELPMRQ